MKKILFAIMAVLMLVSCEESVPGPKKTIIGKLNMMTNPNWTRDSSSDVPIVVLALYTPDTVYYIANSYREKTVDDRRYITVLGQRFYEGEYACVTGYVFFHTDVYDASYCSINIKSIKHYDSDMCGDSYTTHYTSYVYTYVFMKEMRLQTAPFGYGAYPNDSTINSPYGFYAIFDEGYQYASQWQTGSDRSTFDALASKHGDIGYHQDISASSSCPSMPHTFLGHDFASITVTSDADFDEAHPAGTPLNDLIQYMTYSPYPFIQSGYAYTNPRAPRWEKWKEELILIDKPLSACTAEDFILPFAVMEDWFCGGAFPAFYLQVKGVPTLSKQHTLTVSVVDDAGMMWQNTIKLNW